MSHYKDQIRLKKIPFAQTGMFNQLILDYNKSPEKLAEFIHCEPTIKGISKGIQARKERQPDRELLVSDLADQYAESGIKLKGKAKENLALLENDNCFTITTGHQLNLFGGPAYVIYKIASAIAYARELKEAYPQNDFVPIFWMASEDHDFEEINHLHVFSKRYEWKGASGGPVGRMNPKEALTALETICYDIQEGRFRDWLFELLERAYKKENLSHATRFWIHELFQEFGLLIIDADRPALKNAFSLVIKRELLESSSEKAVSEQSDKLLAAGYHNQINARVINLFYMEDGFRERIVKNADGFEVLNSDKSFSEEEILNELKDHPERFSPNVVMRPMIQEFLLPNLAYIGGANEMAYWFQLKSAFDVYELHFPQLVVRSSALFPDDSHMHQLERLDLSIEDFFVAPEMLKSRYLEEEEEAAELFERAKTIEREWQALQKASEEVYDQLQLFAGPFAAERQKELKKFRQDMRKRLRRKKASELELINQLYQELFPGGGFQERHESFIASYLRYGREYLELLVTEFRPLQAELCIFEPKRK